MKVFRVVTERDGRTIREPGVVETELKREEYRYAAERIEQVWQEIGRLLNDQECTVLALHEEHPAITVLPSQSDTEGKG